MQMAKLCGSSKTVTEGDDNSLLKAAEEGVNQHNISRVFIDSICNKFARIKSELNRQNSISGREAESSNCAAESNILRVPDWLHSSAIKHLYEPSVVSIGPYHRNKPLEMQQYKWLALSFLFPDKSAGFDGVNRSCIENCLKKLKELEDTARSYYDKDVIKDLPSDDFLEMMLTDGCFILVFFICPTYFEILEKKDDVWAAIEEVMDDLLLMDNQIPFSIVKEIYSLCDTNYLRYKLTDLRDKFPFFWKLVRLGFLYGDISDYQYENLLDLYHHGIATGFLEFLYYYLERKLLYYTKRTLKLGRIIFSLISSCFQCLLTLISCRGQGESLRGGKPNIIMHSASNLQEKGVIFKKADTVFLVPKVTFSKDGTMKIPCILIEDMRAMNLLAFEQWKYGKNEQKGRKIEKRRNKDTENPMHISVTIYFIACMIKTSKDLELLQNCGIIEIGTKYSDEIDAMEFFKMLRTNLQLNNEEILHNLCQHINRFMNSRKSQWYAKLMKDYFSNPWSILSLFAALMLLMMTFLQTFFTMASYFKSS